MKQQTVALVSIGQSPRQDIAGDFEVLCGQTFRFLDVGALDDVSPEEIARLAPESGEADLITKLRNNQVVYVSHDRLRPYMEKALAKAADQGADWAVVACTGDFQGFKASLPVLQPNRILAHGIAGILNAGDALTILVPTQKQVREAAERWSQRGFTVDKIIVETPFGDHRALFDMLQHDPAVQGTQALIADCFGFGLAFGDSVAAFYDKPVFISRKLIGHLLLAIH